MFDITLKSPHEIAALVVRATALLLALLAAAGFVFSDGVFAKAFAGVLTATFVATAAAPALLGPKVGGALMAVTTALCFLAPEGDAGIQPGRFVLLLVAIPLGFALNATALADPLARMLRRE